MKKLKYGMIGCGGIATSKHYSALNDMHDIVEVIAVCDVIKERALESAKHFGINTEYAFTDYKKLLEVEEIDAVLVLTPNISHSFISVDAMNAGKHVMCEKPMAINSVEAKKMVKTAHETGRLLTIAYQNRYRQDSLYLKKTCENNELGEIYYAKAHALRRKAVPTWGVFTDIEKQGGGPLIDIGTHALDLTLWTMNNYEPEYVVGSVYKKMSDNPDGNMFGEWNPKEINVEDSAFGYIKMKNGTTIILESSWALNTRDIREAQCTLHGTKAGVDMIDGLTYNDAHNGKLRNIKIDLESNEIPFFEGGSVKEECIEARLFANAILNDEELVVTPEQALVVTEILEAIYESSKSNKPIYF
ncbi:MAG: Gfo/Idh/MocA family protein [Anaerocolumna sp.]